MLELLYSLNIYVDVVCSQYQFVWKAFKEDNNSNSEMKSAL